jgi:hypothetical protein
METLPTKVVGKRLKTPALTTPAESLWRASRLIDEMNRLHPWPRPRGFVFKARTYADYERWRRAQENPRLW